ncbi:MAG: CoA-binding protein, partial [Chloroflexota bacterium]
MPQARSAPQPGLDAFFRPRTIAVIGASRNPWKLGYAILDNLQRSRFPGAIYPVNPIAREVLGLKAYASVLDAPRRIDLAVLVVSAPQVAPMLEECGQKGAKGAPIITAGFRETGADGLRGEQELVDIARRYRMRLVGPNSLGVLDTFHNLNASFGEGLPRAYEIAVLSHSGAMASALLDWAALADVGFSKFVSLGNSADVNETDLLEHWARDREAKVIVGYLEGIHDGRSFLDAARKVTSRKPLILMKVGGTDAGARAMASHTGALATSEAVVDAAFRQTGIVRAHTMQELFDFIPCF